MPVFFEPGQESVLVAAEIGIEIADILLVSGFQKTAVSLLFRAIKERDFNDLDMADDRVVSVEASGGNADVRSVKDSGIAGEACNPFIKEVYARALPVVRGHIRATRKLVGLTIDPNLLHMDGPARMQYLGIGESNGREGHVIGISIPFYIPLVN